MICTAVTARAVLSQMMDTQCASSIFRLEGSSGSGIQGFHFTPSGVEFDEKLLRFSDTLSMRASAGLTFPRNIPIDPENDNFGLK